MEIAFPDNPRFQSAISGKAWLAVGIIAAAAGCTAALGDWWWVFAPLSLAIVLISLFHPTWGLYFLTGALFFPYAIIETPHTYPADFIVLFVVIGFWLHRARSGRLGLVRTPIDGIIAVWLTILALSLVNAYDMQRGVINLVRHIQLFLLFYVVVGLADNKVSRQLLGLLVGIATLFAAVNAVPFLQSGGSARVYGVARLSFNMILTVVIIYLTARLCFEPRKGISWLYAGILAIAILGQMANQSRAAIALAGLGIVMVLITAWIWPRAGRSSLPRRRAKQFMAVGFALAAVAFLVAAPYLATLTGRFKGVGNAASTLHFREFIWKTALLTYLDHPIMGIGLGQVQVWEHVLPSLRLQPLGPYTFGLGSHLSFLKYLAESGTLGAGVLLWMLIKVCRIGLAVIRQSKTITEAGHQVGICVVAFAIVLRAFIEGHLFYAVPGMCTVLVWGILMNMYLNNPTKTT